MMLPDKDITMNYGFFGYEGAMIDRSIKSDNLGDMKECVKRGYVDKDCEVIGALSVVDMCRKLKAEKCETWLRSQGWQ